jgi:hypothetical protein
MLGGWLALVGIGLGGAADARPPYAPYADGATNAIYNLLFCDDRGAFVGKPEAPWKTTLAAEPADLPALRALADDTAQDGRVRYLAHARLRELRQPVPARILHGVIVEVPLPGGLDTLAAFSDGSVRYINHSGKMAIFEGVTLLDAQVRGLFAAARPVVEQIGPWTGPRRPPPQGEDMRLTFLVSDGLYFGEGPMDVMAREERSATVVRKAVELFQAVIGQPRQ